MGYQILIVNNKKLSKRRILRKANLIKIKHYLNGKQSETKIGMAIVTLSINNKTRIILQ
jgi:hypothetical protein